MLEFDTFEEADRFLRNEGWSALEIQPEDHYAVYAKYGKVAEIGPGSKHGPNGNWAVQFN